jgi:hypothetical protein
MENCSAGANCTAAQGCPQSNTDTNACYQSPDQWWVWNNDYRGSGVLFGSGDRGTGCIRNNYEYYLRSPQGGDPVESYIKYTYPHPLVSGDYPPNPPVNLRVIEVLDE